MSVPQARLSNPLRGVLCLCPSAQKQKKPERPKAPQLILNGSLDSLTAIPHTCGPFFPIVGKASASGNKIQWPCGCINVAFKLLSKLVELKPRQLINYEKAAGESPFEDWLDSLKDVRARAIIRTRLDRVALGLLGDHRDVGSGVKEMRIDFGPGYRVYYREWKGYTILLLLGGSKKSQSRDIKMAQKYLADFRRRND